MPSLSLVLCPTPTTPVVSKFPQGKWAVEWQRGCSYVLGSWVKGSVWWKGMDTHANTHRHMQVYCMHAYVTGASLEEPTLKHREDRQVLTREMGQQDYGGGVYKPDVTILRDCCEATDWSCWTVLVWDGRGCLAYLLHK